MKAQVIDHITEECRRLGLREVLLLGSFNNVPNSDIRAQFGELGIRVNINEVREVEKEISRFPLSLRSGNYIKDAIIRAVSFSNVDGVAFCNPVLHQQFCPSFVQSIPVPIIEL